MATATYTCDGCSHRDHSGAFTPGGAIPVCRHPMAKGFPDLPGDTPESLFLRAGMRPADAKAMTNRRNMTKSESQNLPDAHHWIRRVRIGDAAPIWCPEPPPVVLRDRVKILREALGELLDPPQGTSIKDRITKGRFALEATKETP